MSGGEKQGFIGEAGHFKRKLDTNTVNFILMIQFKLGPLKKPQACAFTVHLV